MNKIFYSILACVALAGFSSCNDDFIERGHNHAGQAVKFSVGQNKTRTAYLADNFNSEDTWKLKWLDDDEVRIFCDECQKSGDEVPSADYYVIPDEGAPSNGVLEDKGDDEDQLFWGGDGVTHNFYAGYPTTKITECDKNGLMTFKIPTAQYCSLIEIKDEGGNFQDYATNSYNLGSNEEDAVSYINTAMDMSNAYMVANCSSTPEVENVCLAFSPIMTTLEIIVEGYQGVNGATLDLTGIAITMNVPSIDGRGEEFMYDVTHNQIVSDDTQKGIKTTPVSFMINLVNPASPINSITLKEGAKVKLTAFLPPMNITDENQIKVNVQGTGAFTHSVKIGGTGNNLIAAGTKRFISIAGLTKEVNIDVNNWISQLDGSIYVNQLSIPGTSHSASWDSWTQDGDNATAQTDNLDAQWNKGIRAFEFRTGASADGLVGLARDGIFAFLNGYNCSSDGKSGLSQYLSTLADKVMTATMDDEKPGEFAVVLLGFDAISQKTHAFIGYVASSKKNKDGWKSEMMNNSKNGIATFLSQDDGKYKDIIMEFDPKMTIEDARGHIVLINTDKYGTVDASFPGYHGAYIEGFESGAESSEGPDNNFYSCGNDFTLTGKSGSTTIRYQNARPTTGTVRYCSGYIFGYRYSNYEADGKNSQSKYSLTPEDFYTNKIQYAKETDNYAQTLHKLPTFPWVINDLGGAAKMPHMARTADYIASAATINKVLYDYMSGGTRSVGSTGIVLLNHNGVKEAENGTQVYGAALPQLIINNNYQVPMKRKQSGSGAVIK